MDMTNLHELSTTARTVMQMHCYFSEGKTPGKTPESSLWHKTTSYLTVTPYLKVADAQLFERVGGGPEWQSNWEHDRVGGGW